MKFIFLEYFKAFLIFSFMFFRLFSFFILSISLWVLLLQILVLIPFVDFFILKYYSGLMVTFLQASCFVSLFKTLENYETNYNVLISKIGSNLNYLKSIFVSRILFIKNVLKNIKFKY